MAKSQGPSEEELDAVSINQESSGLLPVAMTNGSHDMETPSHIGGTTTHFGSSHLSTGSNASETANTASNGGSSSSLYGVKPRPITTSNHTPVHGQSSAASSLTLNKDIKSVDSIVPGDADTNAAGREVSGTSHGTPASVEALLMIGQNNESKSPIDSPVSKTVPATATAVSAPATRPGGPTPGNEVAVQERSDPTGSSACRPLDPALVPENKLDKPAGFDSVPALNAGQSINSPQEPAEIPEPSTMYLFGLSLAGMLLGRRAASSR